MSERDRVRDDLHERYAVYRVLVVRHRDQQLPAGWRQRHELQPKYPVHLRVLRGRRVLRSNVQRSVPRVYGGAQGQRNGRHVWIRADRDRSGRRVSGRRLRLVRSQWHVQWLGRVPALRQWHGLRREHVQQRDADRIRLRRFRRVQSLEHERLLAVRLQRNGVRNELHERRRLCLEPSLRQRQLPPRSEQRRAVHHRQSVSERAVRRRSLLRFGL